MRLTKHSDYALRILLYVGTVPGRCVSTQEIGEAYGISTHHLLKVVAKLGKHGFLTITRGRAGGVQLGKAPAEISLGDVVSVTEPDFALVECLEHGNNNCALTGSCGLVAPLAAANKAFLATLNEYTLADVLRPKNRSKYRRLLGIVGH